MLDSTLVFVKSIVQNFMRDQDIFYYIQIVNICNALFSQPYIPNE